MKPERYYNVAPVKVVVTLKKPSWQLANEGHATNRMTHNGHTKRALKLK
jgi:hypothetical protein